MKKYLKPLIFAVVLLVVACLLFVFLGSCNYDEKIIGSWQTESYKKDGKTVDELPEDEIYLYEFKADGTGILTMPEQGDTLVFEFKWKLDGKKLILDTSDEEISEFKIKISGKRLKLAPTRTPDVTRTYKKVS